MSESYSRSLPPIGSASPTDQAEQSFMTISRSASVAHAARLGELTSEVRALYDMPDATTILAMSEQMSEGGHTSPAHGLVSIAPKLFAHPDVARFVGVHEAVHAQLGNSLAASGIDAAAPGYRRHFHDVIIPTWLRGTIDLAENTEYLQSRGYDGLVPGGWYGPHDVRLETTTGVMDNFFKLVARDLIMKYPGGRLAHIDKYSSRWQSELDSTSPVGPEAYAGREAWLAELAITGMSVGRDLAKYSHRTELPGRDLLTWEEGVANRIASDLTGVSLEAANDVARQDPTKLIAAHKLKDAGLTGQALAKTVRSYSDLYALIRKHF